MTDVQLAELTERAVPAPTQDDSIDLLDVLLVLARDRRRIVIVTLAFLLLSGGIAFLLKPTFTATATILPPQQQQSSLSTMLGELGPLAGLAGGGGMSGLLKNPADMYVGMIQSRTVADRLIKQFHLQSVYRTKTMDDTRKVFEKHVSAKAAKDGLIKISVEDHDPRRASEMANGVVDALYKLTSSLAITDAAQRRLFFGEQLDSEKAALAAAEEDLKKTQQKTGLIQLNDQAAVIIGNVAQLQAEIVARQVQMQSMRVYATEANPDVTRLQEQIDALQKQLSALENSQRQLPAGDIQVPTGRVPEVGLQYARKLREVTFHTALLALLEREYEAARIDEAKSAPLIQVVDHAVPPQRKSGPILALWVVVGGFLGLVVGCLWAWTRHILRRIESIPENSVRLRELRSALSLGRTASRRFGS